MPSFNKYKIIRSVATSAGGIPVKLALQRRLDVPPKPFYTISWRTRYPGTTQNRRFYWSSDGSCWTIAVSMARDLLTAAERERMLDAQYDDTYERFGGGTPTLVESVDLSPSDRAALWREITFPDREPDWGADPSFVVATEFGHRWRKIMIVDSRQDTATFRSCTTDPDYRLGQALPGTQWRMDNAMQDASTAIMRRFLDVLRALRG
jgi:hypothetical protein